MTFEISFKISESVHDPLSETVIETLIAINFENWQHYGMVCYIMGQRYVSKPSFETFNKDIYIWKQLWDFVLNYHFP